MLEGMDTENLALRPNCLLTKYPLVFLTGPRSLFHYEKLGGDLQDFIAAHGYQVLSPVLPFRSRPLRRLQLGHWLRHQTGRRFHFILGENSLREFGDILAQYPESSHTVIPRDLVPWGRQKAAREPLRYRLHRLFCSVMGIPADPFAQTLAADQSRAFYDRFLDHCIELAENEPL